MSKFNITGQVAGLSQEDAVSARASNAVTDSGYLGGNSWLKTQIDAQKALFREDPTKIPGYDFVNFNDAKEGMVIPDGAFDFFDLTYDLSIKNVKEAIVFFKSQVAGSAAKNLPAATFACPPNIGPLGSERLIAPFNNDLQGFQQKRYTVSDPEGHPGSGTSNPCFIVTEDYKECGPFGSFDVGKADNSTSTVVGYKITGQNPPTDDAGAGIYRGTTSNYAYNFWQYQDATAAQTGFRYMVGVYSDSHSALSSDSNDKYVVKSMAFKTTKAGVCQLVLHCRKAAATTGVTINASGTCAGIQLLKLNY